MASKTYYALYNEDGVTFDPAHDVLLGFGTYADRRNFMADAPGELGFAAVPVTFMSVRNLYDLHNPIDICGHFIFNPRRAND